MAWLSGWSYRKGLAISSPTDLTDYQIKVLVGESPAVVGTNVNCQACLPSFNDLRFTQSDGTTLLNYWIEEVSGVSPLQTAVVWVKVPSISTNTPIYLYSGNASAPAGSNGANTFLFFDDASTNRSSEYTLPVPSSSGAGILSWSSGYYSLEVTTTGHISALINPLGSVKNIALHTEIYRATNARNQQGGMAYAGGYTRYITTAANRLELYTNGTSFNYTLPQSVWKKLMVAYADNSLVATWKNMDNTVIWNSTYTPTSSVTPGRWGFFGAYDAGAKTRYRRTFARKYTSPEPTILYTFSLLADYTAEPLSGYVPLPVQFQDLSSPIETISSWNWNFGDGNTSTDQNPSHTYDAPGLYTVSLTASDGIESSTKTESDYITVNATVADFTMDPLTVSAGHIVNFTDTSLGNITGWLWDFGDGFTSTDQNPSHTYTVADVYDVTLTVTSLDESVTSITKTITCLLSPEFDVSATSGYAPLTINFTDSSLGSPSGWDWDFGDGTEHSSEANPIHRYVNLGSYTITLTITKDGVPPAILTKTEYITVNTTAIIQQLTRDLDNNRINGQPCIIASPLGQLFIFYSKTWYTGKKSYSRIKYTSPFSVQVEAGNGVINGVSVSWDAAALTASPEEYQLVYVTPDRVVHIRSNITMTEMRTIIPLAYVKSGLYGIAQLEELEWTGRYIFLRKQINTGSGWEWDDYEYRLNTGEQPKAFYDAVNNMIYMSYKKDSISYNRVFNPTNDLTWEYLQNVSIVTNNITLNRNPQNSTLISISAGNRIDGIISSDEYPISTTGFCFVGKQVYIYLPTIGGSYVQDAYGPLTYEILTKVGGTYTVEASFILPYMNYRYMDINYRFREWTGTIGVKYIRIRTYTRFFLGEFITSQVNYRSVELYDYPALVSPLEPYDDTHDLCRVDTRPNRAELAVSAGYKAAMTKTAEYMYTDIINRPDEISDPIAVSAGYKVAMTKTAEYMYTDIINIIDNITDPSGMSGSVSVSAGYKIAYSIESLPIT